MKKLFLVFLFLQSLSLAQLDNTNRWMMRGDNTILSFVSQEDLTNDTLIFVVKASKDITSVRLIEKTSYNSEISIAYSTLSFIYIELEAGDTDDLTLAKYYYDITRVHNADTSTIIIGELNIQPDIGTPFDGTDITGRVTTVSLANGTLQDEIVVWDTTANKWIPSGNLIDYVTDTLRQEFKKIYAIVENGSVTTWNVFGFNSDATNVISGDTLIVTDASGELNFEGIVSSNDYDFTIVGTPTAYQIKVEWGGFTGKTISFIWELDTLSQAYPLYSGTVNNIYNSGVIDTTFIYQEIATKLDITDTTNIRTFSNLKYLANGDSTQFRTFSNLKYVSKTALADSNFVKASEIKTGTDSIHYGQDSIVVTHGVGSTPRFISIQLVSDGFGFQTWVSGINSLTFYVRRSDTGLKTITSSIQFKWMAYK